MALSLELVEVAMNVAIRCAKDIEEAVFNTRVALSLLTEVSGDAAQKQVLVVADDVDAKKAEIVPDEFIAGTHLESLKQVILLEELILLLIHIWLF